jgi:hypothetical protein
MVPLSLFDSSTGLLRTLSGVLLSDMLEDHFLALRAQKSVSPKSGYSSQPNDTHRGLIPDLEQLIPAILQLNRGSRLPLRGLRQIFRSQPPIAFQNPGDMVSDKEVFRGPGLSQLESQVRN